MKKLKCVKCGHKNIVLIEDPQNPLKLHWSVCTQCGQDNNVLSDDTFREALEAIILG